MTMTPHEDPVRAQATIEHLRTAGMELEQARTLVVIRAEVALAAGGDLRTIAQAAGVQPATLRTWLTRRRGPSSPT